MSDCATHLNVCVTVCRHSFSPRYLSKISRVTTRIQTFFVKTDGQNKSVNPLSTNPKKSSITLKQFVGNMPTNFLSVFDHFVGLALKELRLITC